MPATEMLVGTYRYSNWIGAATFVHTEKMRFTNSERGRELLYHGRLRFPFRLAIAPPARTNRFGDAVKHVHMIQ
jgi:hypothetical protein